MGPERRVEQLEASAALPAGSGERFNGYGVMGLPFRSGHVLAMRRFPASSVGPAYTSVWHRTPDGEWIFYADVPPRQACTRYFGAIASQALEAEIAVEWPEPLRLRIAMPEVNFEWDLTLGTTPATRFLNGVGRLLPESAWQSRPFLAAMGRAAGLFLGAGRVGLQGQVPNGQHFIASPRLLWVILDSRARLGGEAFGRPGPVHPQARLGDFWIPQRGVLAIGRAYFETYDPARHRSTVTRTGGGSTATR